MAADADLGGRGGRGQAWAAGREARPGLGFPVTVPVAVGVDATAGQAGQDGVPVRFGQLGGQAGGGRAGPGGGDDRAAGGGERYLAGMHRLAGPLTLAGRDRDRRGGAGRRAGQLGGGDPGGVLLGDQGRGLRAEHRPGGRTRPADRRLGFLQAGLRPDPPPVIGGGQRFRRVGGMVEEVGDQGEQLRGICPATVMVYSITRTVSVTPPPEISAR